MEKFIRKIRREVNGEFQKEKMSYKKNGMK